MEDAETFGAGVKHMTQNGPLRQKLVERFDDMSPQLQQAARYLLDHPQDVALNSMRELARNAGVQPATMTRLAKFLGADGYDELRNEQAEAIRRAPDGLLPRALASGSHPPAGSPQERARAMLLSLSAQIARLAEPEGLAQIAAAAACLKQAKRIYVLGARSCHSVAWQFHYVMSLLGEASIHLDGPGGTGTDPLIHAGEGDVLMVISLLPYARQSVEITEFAKNKAMTVVAITDSAVSPFVTLADHVILCPVESPSFFHNLSPALAVSEVLCGLLAQANRTEALDHLARTDAQLKALNTYSSAVPRRDLR